MWQPLRRVVVRAPNRDFSDADPERWHYAHSPDLARARAQHAELVRLLEDVGAEVLEHSEELPGLADSLFVHDPVLVTDRGAIVLRMGKALRRGEEEALGGFLESVGVPIRGRLRAPAVAECGDMCWLDEGTLAVGLGYRTNRAAIDQLREMLEDEIDVLPVPLPVGDGEQACLHLQSLISVVDRDLAVVYRRYLPVGFDQELSSRGFERIEVPDDEFGRLGPNVLALGPRHCVVVRGNPEVARRLEAAGCRVELLVADDLCLPAEGGPTCLTRPVLRRL